MNNVTVAFSHLLMYCHNSNVQLLPVTLKDISVIKKKKITFFGGEKLKSNVVSKNRHSQNHPIKNTNIHNFPFVTITDRNVVQH